MILALWRYFTRFHRLYSSNSLSLFKIPSKSPDQRTPLALGGIFTVFTPYGLWNPNPTSHCPPVAHPDHHHHHHWHHPQHHHHPQITIIFISNIFILSNIKWNPNPTSQCRPLKEAGAPLTCDIENYLLASFPKLQMSQSFSATQRQFEQGWKIIPTFWSLFLLLFWSKRAFENVFWLNSNNVRHFHDSCPAKIYLCP